MRLILLKELVYGPKWPREKLAKEKSPVKKIVKAAGARILLSLRGP